MSIKEKVEKSMEHYGFFRGKSLSDHIEMKSLSEEISYHDPEEIKSVLDELVKSDEKFRLFFDVAADYLGEMEHVTDEWLDIVYEGWE